MAMSQIVLGNRTSFTRCTALALALCLSAVGTSASAAQRAVSTDAVIVTPLSFLQFEDLEFGTLLAGTTPGTVVVDPSGARTKTGGVTLVGGLVQPSRFAGLGRFNQNVQVSLAANSITLTRVSGTQTMVVDTFVIGSTPTAVLSTNPRVFRISAASGLFSFPLGATLRVGANQTPGNYVGTFSVILNYQ